MVSRGISLIFISGIFSSKFWSSSMSSTNHMGLLLKDRMRQTALASRARGSIYLSKVITEPSIDGRSLQGIRCRLNAFPVSPFNLALYLQHLLELSNSSSSINAAFLAVLLESRKSLTLPYPAVIAIKEGAVCLSAKEIHRKGPLETDHLKSLDRQVNFQDLLQLRNFVRLCLCLPFLVS